MQFGIDTNAARLDLLPAIATGGGFLAWNGGAAPLFAGRNFLGGDFLWAHAEATNALGETAGVYPPAANAPSPEHPENLTLLVSRIAPIQAPMSDRQQIVGERGRLFGMIDADAICRRVANAITAGEFATSDARKMHIWLSVDSTVAFSADYWAGWADKVNNFPVNTVVQGANVPQQLFLAGIVCSYVKGDGGLYRPDPHVVAALATPHRGMDTSVHGMWADLKVWDDAPADLVANGNALLNWNEFDPPTAPVLWRFAHGFSKPDGTPAAVAFNVSGANPTAEPLAFMLQTQKWQPTEPTIQNFGFSVSDPVTAAQAQCLQGTPVPAMDDNNFRANTGHFHVRGGPVKIIGRYVRHSPAFTMTAAEAELLCDAGIRLFTIWESVQTLAGQGASEPSELDQTRHPIAMWGDFRHDFHHFIFYFDSDPDGNPATHDDAGSKDGTDGFRYCGDTLKQTPQTPIFFSIDFDPWDLPDPHAVPPPPPPVPPAVPPPPGGVGTPTLNWPALPPVATREQWILSYFVRIKAARDAYATQTGRYYLIGAYGNGRAMRLLYEQGIVSHFWQAGSSGRSGSRPPAWPWGHVNRWQYQGNRPGICTIGNIDPDADWGDGGDWSLNDQTAQDLAQFERIGAVGEFIDWGDLVVPPVPPVPSP